MTNDILAVRWIKRDGSTMSMVKSPFWRTHRHSQEVGETGGEADSFDHFLFSIRNQKYEVKAKILKLRSYWLTIPVNLRLVTAIFHFSLDFALNRSMSSCAFFFASRSFSSKTSAQGWVTRQVSLPLRGGSGYAPMSCKE